MPLFSNRRLQEHVSETNSLHLVLGEPFLGAIIKLGRAWALVRSYLLRVLERAAAVREIGGNPGGAKRVATDCGRDAGLRAGQ